MNIVLAISLVVSSDTPSDQDQVGADWSKKRAEVDFAKLIGWFGLWCCVFLQCAFYFMNVVIDTTLGVYIAYLLLQLSTIVAVRYRLLMWSFYCRNC